jgi:hypothetical protein
MSAHRRLAAIGAVTLVLAVALLPGVSRAQDDAPASKWIQLLWDVESVDAGAVAEYHARESDLRITTIARWDNGDQRWLLWRPGVPVFVNAFTRLDRGSIYWFRATYIGPGPPAFDITPGIESAPQVDAGIVIAAEHNRAGYDRRLFRHWIDADGDGCDTRREVLIRDAVEAPVVGAGCSLSGGRWVSLHDGEVFTGDGGGLDIDHMVPLAEAWESGAWAWSAERRRAFANDLEHRFALLAVSASTNRSKGARDLAEWLPPDESSHCLYATYWRDTKVAWGLTFDQAEVVALVRALATCRN